MTRWPSRLVSIVSPYWQANAIDERTGEQHRRRATTSR